MWLGLLLRLVNHKPVALCVARAVALCVGRALCVARAVAKASKS